MPEDHSSTATAASRAVLAAIFVVALLPLFSTPLLPFIDLYNHLARYFVLAHIADSPMLGTHYEAHWSLLPNIGLDVVGTQLLRVLPPVYAAHVVVVAIFIVQYGGILAFNRALTGRTSVLVALLAVPLLYSFILNWGFANFLLGLGMVFWAAAWWLRRRHRLVVALPVAVVLAVAIFFTHGLAFALYGILVGMLEIGLWLNSRPRRPLVLLRNLVPLAAQAVIPVLLFVAATTSKAPTGLTNADESIARLNAAGELPARLWTLFCHRLMTILRVEESPQLWLDVVTFVLQLAIILVLVRRGRARIAPPAWPALAIGIVLVAIVPPAMFGVGYVADRMPLFLAMLLVGSIGLTASAARDAFTRNAVIAVAAIVAVRLVAIAIGWQAYAADYREFRQVAALIPPGSMVDDVIVGGVRRDSDEPRCPMYRPLLISLDRQVGPLFANETQQPLRLIGPLRAAVDALPKEASSSDPRPGQYDDMVAAAGPAGFDYLLICNVGSLTRALPSNSRMVAQTRRFTLIHLER